MGKPGSGDLYTHDKNDQTWKLNHEMLENYAFELGMFPSRMGFNV
jgi:hypothetical protein